MSAHNLQTFEPLRLGSRYSDYVTVISQLAGRKQSEIVRLLEANANDVLREEDDDIEGVALGVTLLVLRDYVTAGHYPVENRGSVFLADVATSESLSAGNSRTLLRRQYEAARDRALRDRHQIDWLRAALRQVHQSGYAAHEIVSLLREGPPAVALVDARENRSGLDARGLWRCVRSTWSMGPEASAPGREVAFLAIDERRPTTPLGILQFRNVVPEIRCRDQWLGVAVGVPAGEGQDGAGFLGLIGHGKTAASRVEATTEVLERLIESLNTDGLTVPLATRSITSLSELAQRHRELFDNTRRTGDQGLKNEHLRILKRAQTAQDLLRGIKGLRALLSKPEVAHDESTRADIDAGLTKLWHYHMGFVAIEMSICGAAPPFGPLRVGKLMAALAGTYSVLNAWGWDRPLGQISQEVYLPSVRDRVPNPGPLVIFTSGLYPGHSAQYTRVRSGGSQWRKIGETTGYGSFHISFETTEAIRRLNALIDGYTHITRTFGEGSGARFRSVGRGLSYLGLPDLRKHETKRPLYALPLVENVRETLLGWEEPRRPPPSVASNTGVAWWRRWVQPRVDELIDAAKRVPDLEAEIATIVGRVG